MNDNTDLSVITEDEKALSAGKRYLASYKNQRQQIDWQFYKNEAYYRGNHFTRWNRLTKSLETPPARQGELRIPIPIAKDIVQRTLLEVVKDRPAFDIIPENTSDQEIQRARWSKMLLDALYEKHRLGRKVKQVVLHGLKFSVGVMEVFWNPELDEDGDVDYRLVDPNDFYIGLNFEDPADAPCVIKIIRKDIGYLANSELYKKNRGKWLRELNPDNKVTDSEWREHVLATTYGDYGDEVDIPTPQGSVLLAECYLKYYPKGSVKPKYRIVTFSVKQGILLRNEETELERPPFFVYHTDQSPGEFYGEGWLKHLIPLNKAMDLMENKSLAHHHKYIGGKYVMDTGADPSQMTNEAGQFIEINPGRRFEPLQVPPIPPTTRETVESWHRYAQDTGGVHDVTLGRVPEGVESARAIESLIRGDEQSKSDLRDNLEDFLEEVGEYSLKLISENYSSSRLVSFYDERGEVQQFTAVGEGSQNPYKDEVGVVIKPRNDVKVTVGSKLGSTPDARQQKVIELFQMGLLPREEVLKEFQISNIGDVAKRAYDQAMEMLQAKNQAPKRDTRDYVNTKLSDLGPTERSQYLESIGIKPEQDQALVPGSVEATQALERSKANNQLENTLVSGEAQAEAQQQQKVRESLDPVMPGGLIDAMTDLGINNEGEQPNEQL